MFGCLTAQALIITGSYGGESVTMHSYDAVAEWYSNWVGPHSMSEDPFFAGVEALMGDVAGMYICDLACGEGRVARHLANLGARVVGIDLSANLLATARRHEKTDPRGIQYIRCDAAHLDGVDDDAFDGVICHMALMDIEDLESTLHAVVRTLQPGGWFIFAILHPCFNPAKSGELQADSGWTRTVSGYFEEGYWRSDARTGPPGKVGAWHRTLSTYINALSDAGLTVERMSEPQLGGSHAECRPIWTEVPAVLIVKCRLR